ncbi:PaaI family thioesterase [Aneurinibacillus thermoaerophilus]|uniref:PaaI family thioesterase n=1 Tax=Aneurinibacillus thermoaerophilus TaxID=143495 RepID=UPI001FE3DE71|nr:PaaI family thioesterase [Aneurinibacillus thermoaerophilus]
MQKDQESLLEFIRDTLKNGTEDEQQILYLARQAIEYMRDRKRKTAYLSGFLGLQGEYLEDGTYRFEVPITPFMLNGLNIVHGGITATLADAVMGSVASRSTGYKVVTTEMNVHYLSPGTGDKLIATASVLRRGKTLCVCECKIHNDQSRLILAGTGTFYLIEPR